jgi:hypothetical protein
MCNPTFSRELGGVPDTPLRQRRRTRRAERQARRAQRRGGGTDIDTTADFDEDEARAREERIRRLARLRGYGLAFQTGELGMAPIGTRTLLGE